MQNPPYLLARGLTEDHLADKLIDIDSALRHGNGTTRL
jgi:hypothetical protein